MSAHTNTYGTKTYASDEKNIGNHKNILTKRASDTYKSVAYLPISFFFCIAPPAFNKRSDNLSGLWADLISSGEPPFWYRFYGELKRGEFPQRSYAITAKSSKHSLVNIPTSDFVNSMETNFL